MTLCDDASRDENKMSSKWTVNITQFDNKAHVIQSVSNEHIPPERLPPQPQPQKPPPKMSESSHKMSEQKQKQKEQLLVGAKSIYKLPNIIPLQPRPPFSLPLYTQPLIPKQRIKDLPQLNFLKNNLGTKTNSSPESPAQKSQNRFLSAPARNPSSTTSQPPSRSAICQPAQKQPNNNPVDPQLRLATQNEREMIGAPTKPKISAPTPSSQKQPTLSAATLAKLSNPPKTNIPEKPVNGFHDVPADAARPKNNFARKTTGGKEHHKTLTTDTSRFRPNNEQSSTSSPSQKQSLSTKRSASSANLSTHSSATRNATVSDSNRIDDDASRKQRKKDTAPQSTSALNSSRTLSAATYSHAAVGTAQSDKRAAKPATNELKRSAQATRQPSSSSIPAPRTAAPKPTANQSATMSPSTAAANVQPAANNRQDPKHVHRPASTAAKSSQAPPTATSTGAKPTQYTPVSLFPQIQRVSQTPNVMKQSIYISLLDEDEDMDDPIQVLMDVNASGSNVAVNLKKEVDDGNRKSTLRTSSSSSSLSSQPSSSQQKTNQYKSSQPLSQPSLHKASHSGRDKSKGKQQQPAKQQQASKQQRQQSVENGNKSRASHRRSRSSEIDNDYSDFVIEPPHPQVRQRLPSPDPIVTIELSNETNDSRETVGQVETSRIRNHFKVSVDLSVNPSGPSRNFWWIDECRLHKDTPLPDLSRKYGCQCDSDCNDSSDESCICTVDAGPYYDKHGRVLTKPREVLIMECNSSCSCSKSCPNRVIQHGSKIAFQIIYCGKRGWGVQTLRNIRQGTFVTTYVGEIITETEARRRTMRNYQFSLDFNREVLNQLENPVELVVDSYMYGNISRFFNHACEPNMGVYCAQIEEKDENRHHVAFFAVRDIKAGEELTFDYAGVAGSNEQRMRPSGRKNGKIEDWNKCICGSSQCRGYLWPA